MIIAQISDTHISIEHEDGPRRTENLKSIIRTINDLDPLPDLVIHTGDLVNRGKPEEYELAASLLQALNIPFHPVPGNRDHRSLMKQALNRINCPLPSGEFLHYVIDDYPVRLIGLDTQSGLNNMGALCPDRLTWLQETLNLAPGQPTALFMHHPPFDILKAKDPFQFNRREDARKLEKIVTENSQIIRLFCGHAHRSDQVNFGGISATTIPSVATSLQKGTEEKIDDRHPPLFLHVFSPGKNAFTTGQKCVK